MSTIRATKSYQAQPKSDVSSADNTRSTHPIEGAHDTDALHNSLDHASARELENRRLFHENLEKHVHQDDALTPKPAHTQQQQKKPQVTSHSRDHVDLNKEKEDDFKVKAKANSDDEDDSKKEIAPPTQGVGMGMNSGMPVVKNETVDTLSGLFSAAVSSLSSSADQHASDFKSEGLLGSSAALGETLPQPVATALRTARFSDFLSELTATVTQARFNSASGQDITLQLRSDVLDATNVHINANATHMEVAFSTMSAASNALINAQLATLKNHLIALCPGQAIEVKNQFLTSSNASEFNNERESREDLASFNQENRGNLNNHDDAL